MLHSIPLGILSFSTGGFQVANSAMFNEPDDEYFTRTPSSASNQRTWTFSTWVKRGKLGSDQRIFTAASNGGELFFDANDKLNAYQYEGGYTWNYISTQVFRDPHAWYHIVQRVDTTQGNSGDRVRLYVNGAQITAFDTSTAPSQNATGYVNSAVAHYIGRYSASNSSHYDGYLAETVLIDGQGLAPTSFGETDDNGVWRPIDLDDSGLFTVSSTVEAIANVTSAVTSSGAASYAFSSVSLGTAAANRAIYVFASGQDPEGDNVAVSSLTINVGGSDIAGSLVSVVDSGAEPHYSSELWRVDVPTGTSGTVDVNWDQATSQCGIIVWAVTGDHSMYDLKTDTTNSTSSVSFTNVPDNSVILAGKAGTGSSLTSTWSSAVTENVDQAIDGTGPYHTGASKAHGTGGNFTVTCTPSGTDNRPRMFAMVLSPKQGVGNNGFYLNFSGTGAALGSNSALSNTFTPAAANYTYNSTYLTIGSGTIDNNGAPGVSGRLNNPFSGDFTFSFTATAIAGSIFGCFDADELSTFATGTDDGGLDGMTKSWWYDDGGNGSGGAGSVGAGKIMYGNATQASSAIAAGSAVTITRTGSTIKITDDGSDHHTFSQTHEGPVYIMVGNRNITSKSMNFDAVSMTGTSAFAAVNSPTQTNDSPTKNYAVLSQLTHQTNGDLSKGNTQTTTGSADQGLSFSTFPVTTGQKVYIEALCSGATTCMTGCVKATSAVVQNPLSDFDALESADGGAGRLLHVATGDVFNSDGNTSATNYAPNDSVPVRHMIALDLVNDKIYWGDAGVGASGWSDGSGSFDQTFDNAVGVDLTANLDWFFAFRPFTGTIEVNFGATAFTVDPPTGYSSGYSAAIENENRETSLTIKDPDDHFKEVIVDHDGSSTNFTIPWSTYNGTNGTYDTLFSIKRLADEKWFVIDSIRGLNKYFSWNATTSQTTDANVLSVSGTTGTLGSTLADDNYLVQMYRLNAQSSRDTSNSEGSITGGSNSLIISANATAGWSVCTYTGTGANGTFGHGLSQAPEWIRWYNTVSADGQTVYHAFNPSTPKDHYGNFDSAPTTLTNDDSTKFNDTAPTADVNSVGSADSTNGSSDAMWCFSVHSVNSFSKVGAFVGNGNANGPFAEASISPKSVVLKNANGSASGDDWYLVTDTRFLYNGDASTLAFNLTATEQATNLFDMVSNGIKLRTTNAGVNESSNTIVYQIIGSPFAGTTPATAR